MALLIKADKAVMMIIAALLAAAVLLSAAPFPAQGGTAEGVSFIRLHQAPDGGFYEPGREGSGQDPLTAWCVMALRAAGVDPGSVRRGGRSPVDFLATQSGNWRSVTDYERTLLAVTAAGADPRSFGGVDLVEAVLANRRPAGNIGDAVNTNAFGILALVSAGVEPPPGSVSWHRMAQNADGGWGNSPGAASNPDMTAASVMALRAAGVGAGDPSITAALGYLHSIQAPDGGFSFQPGSSDASATAWCVQAIVAVGQDPGGSEWSRDGATPRGYLLSMQDPDGRFRWTTGRDMNPVWTTSYAICALAGKPFPVAVAPAPAPSGGGSGGEPQAAGEEEAPGAQTEVVDEGQTGETQEQEGAEADSVGEEDEALSLKEGRPEGRALAERSQSPAGAAAGVWIWWLIGGLAALAAAAFLFLKPGPLRPLAVKILRRVKNEAESH